MHTGCVTTSAQPSGQAKKAGTISDPVRIRAVAHPLRLALLDFLDRVPEGTATECAAATGASVASCSYHLRILAKNGFIEQVPRPGREKPWRTLYASRNHSIDPALPGSQHALAALSGVLVEQQFARIMDWVQSSPALPASDLEPASIVSSTFYATPEEVIELRQAVAGLLDQYLPRRTDPSLRPEGAREVHYFGVTNLEPQPPQAVTGERRP